MRLVERRRLLGACLMLITLAAAFFALQIDFDFTPQRIYAGDGDLLAYAEGFKQDFGYDDAAVLIVLEARDSADVLDAAALNWQAEVADRLAALPAVEHVTCVANLEIPRSRLWRRPWIVPSPLIESFPVDSAAAAKTRETLDDYRLLDGALLSEDRRLSAVICFVEPDARRIARLRGVMGEIEGALGQVAPPAGYTVRLSGLPPMRTEIVGQLLVDQARLLPLAAVTMIVVLWLIFRSAVGVLLPLIAAGAGLAWWLAVLVVAGQTLDLISNVLPVLLFILGVSNCVHVVSRYGEESRRAVDRPHVVTAVIARMTVPCFLAFLTTGIGFASLIFAHSDALKAFGWQAALGTMLLYISTMFWTVVLLPVLDPPRRNTTPSALFNLLGRVFDTTPRLAIRNASLILLTGIAVAGCSLWAARGMQINSQFIETYEPDHPTVQTIELVEEKLAGFLPLEISLHGSDGTTLLDPEVVRRVAELGRLAAAGKPVLFVRSYVDILDAVFTSARQQRFPLFDPRIADDLAARRIRWTDGIARQVSEAVGYNAFMTSDGTRARVLLRVKDVGTRETLGLIAELEQHMATLLPPELGIETRLTGEAYLNAKALDGFVRDLLVSLAGACVVIFGVIALVFRSPRLGLIVGLPNLIPLVITLGYIALRGYELNVANVIVFAIGIGVVVDDTVHLVSRFREALADGHPIGEALHLALACTGRTIVMTTILIVSGLAVLSFSDFLPTRRFAELTSVTMAAALVGDLLLLPASLLLFHRRETSITTRSSTPVDGALPAHPSLRAEYSRK